MRQHNDLRTWLRDEKGIARVGSFGARPGRVMPGGQAGRNVGSLDRPGPIPVLRGANTGTPVRYPLSLRPEWPRGKDRLADAHHDSDHRHGHRRLTRMAAAPVKTSDLQPGGSPAQWRSRHSLFCCAHPEGRYQQQQDALQAGSTGQRRAPAHACHIRAKRVGLGSD